jgi:hypothetical protein
VYKQYQQTLKEQMKEKSEAKTQIINQMNEHEKMFNKKTLQDIESAY